MLSIIVTDKTVEGAINKAVVQLKVSSKDDINVVVLENGSKGFLGFGSRDAKIEATIKEKDVDIDLDFKVSLDKGVEVKSDNSNELLKVEQLAKEFLQKTLTAMEIEAEYITKVVDKNIEVTIKSNKDNVLIGKRGKTLESLEFLTNLAINKGKSKYVNIYLDVANYKQKRKETLEQLAENLSKKVCKTKRRHKLEPMSRFERKIIHNALQDNEYIKTYSEGVEPHRYIVIDARQK